MSEYETYMMIVDEVEEMFPRLSEDEHLKKCCKTAFEITKVIFTDDEIQIYQKENDLKRWFFNALK